MRYVVAIVIGIFAAGGAGVADASRPPSLDASTAQEAFEDAAAPLGDVWSAACTAKEGLATEFVCYAWFTSDTTIDLTDSIVTATVRTIDGVVTVDEMVLLPASGAATSAATTTTTPVVGLTREAELAVRACIDGIYPITFIVGDLNMLGDMSTLEEVQAACDDAHTQLQVEDAPFVVDLNLCVTEVNLQLSAVAMDWILDQELDPAKLELFDAVRMTNGAAMTTLVESGAGTCDDDVKPLL